jgi:hypothetical protein
VLGSKSSGVPRAREPHASTSCWNNATEFGNPQTARAEPEYKPATISASRSGLTGESKAPTTTEFFEHRHCTPLYMTLSLELKIIAFSHCKQQFFEQELCAHWELEVVLLRSHGFSRTNLALLPFLACLYRWSVVRYLDGTRGAKVMQDQSQTTGGQFRLQRVTILCPV